MYIRVVFLLLVNFLFVFPTYIAASDLREVLQEKVNNALTQYKLAHERQTSVYPKCDTFTDAYTNVGKVLRETIDHVSILLIALQETELSCDKDLSPQNHSSKKTSQICPSNGEKAIILRDNLSKETLRIYAINVSQITKLWKLLDDTLNRKYPSFKPSNVFKKRTNFETAKNLLEVFETNVGNISKSIQSLAPPTYSEDTFLKTTRVLIALCDWKKKARNIALNEFLKPEFIKDILESIHKTGRINFVQFVCPNVDFSFLSSSTPEKYFLSTVDDSLFSRQKDTLIELVKNLRPTGIPINLCFMIGDDEDYYFWPDEKSCTFPIFRKPEGLTEEKLSQRREEYRLNIGKYIHEHLDDPHHLSEYPPVGVEVHNLHHEKLKVLTLGVNQDVLKEVFTNCQKYFNEEEHEIEKERMKQLAENYYRELFLYFARTSGNSSENVRDRYLPAIIRAKFATYALDGLTAYDRSPFAILLQTESPPELRTKMMNTGRKIRDKKVFSVIYLSNEKDSKRNLPTRSTGEKIASKSKISLLVAHAAEGAT